SVGVWGLPPGLGNPFTGRSTPSIFVWDAIFEPMVRIDAEGAPAAVLAESWQPVEPMRWRFTLRDGITFSNGAPFDADAVVTTFEYLLSEEGRATPVGSEMAGIAAVEKVDDRTVDIVTDQPDPVLPSKLALAYIVEPGQWQELGPEGFAERPAGTGPFAVEAWNPGEAVLVANPNAWHAPQIERLRVVDLPERPARLQALLSGQIDVAFGLSPDNL